VAVAAELDLSPAELEGLLLGWAEESGAILQLGRWVLSEACEQAAAWPAFGPAGRGLTVTVNLSAAQLQEPSFVTHVEAVLARTGLRPRQLVLEMTETVMFHDSVTTMAQLSALRALGVRIAIDDFGTGYSSLGYLRRFPVDILKIAREFICGAESHTDWAFAAAIVALGRALDLAIIAEAIEEPGQLTRLRELGCAPADAATIGDYFASEALLARHRLGPTAAASVPPLRLVAASTATTSPLSV